MKRILIVGLLVWAIGGCSPKYEFWKLSRFNLNENALNDKEQIKILYTSQAPDNNKDLDYYIHIIAVSQVSGDTVNILTTANNGLRKEDGEQVFNFYNSDNIATKMLQINLDDLDLNNLDKIELKKINKVARDPEFDYLADNSFPTIIGVIGKSEN